MVFVSKIKESCQRSDGARRTFSDANLSRSASRATKEKQNRLGGERSAAAAGAGGVGIGEFKTAAVNTGDEIYDRALKIGSARSVHVNFKTILLQNGIVWFLFPFKAQLVRKTGAAAIRYRDAQTVAFKFV